jgi:putative tricarboxylic transport membrane protein
MKNWLRRPWWVGVAIVALGGLWLYGSSSLSQWSSIAGIGPGVFVTLIGVGLIACGVVLVFEMTRCAIGPATSAEEGAEKSSFNALPFVTAIVALASPIVLMTSIGFPLTAALIFAGVTHAFGSRRTLFDFLIGAVMSVTCWFIFRSLGVDLGGFLPLIGI